MKLEVECFSSFLIIFAWHFHIKKFLRPTSKPNISICRQMSKGKSRLLIGNIHVLYNPSRGDVKLGQVSRKQNKNYIYIPQMWIFIQVFLDILNTCVLAKIIRSSISTLSFCDFKLYVVFHFRRKREWKLSHGIWNRKDKPE